MGLALDDCVQVSMNLVDYRVTSMHTVFEEVARRAADHARRGAAQRGRRSAAARRRSSTSAAARCGATEFTQQQVLEARVLDLLTDAQESDLQARRSSAPLFPSAALPIMLLDTNMCSP